MAGSGKSELTKPTGNHLHTGWPGVWARAPKPKPSVDTAALRLPAAVRGRRFDCFCASRLEQVVSAWQLVYRRYVEMELIHENPFGIHTTTMAVGPQASVICGSAGGDGVHTTMTLMADTAQGLPLDSIYASYLDTLRHNGRRLVEVGLLADRRRDVARGAAALFRMMRWAAYYTLHTGSTDIVIGVHPHHMPFYVRCYGFETLAPSSYYPLVRDNPVVPLRLRLREALARDVLPRGLVDVRDNPLAADAFAERFEFKSEQLHGSLIEAFLQA